MSPAGETRAGLFAFYRLGILPGMVHFLWRK
jgi:hypothetical protein